MWLNTSNAGADDASYTTAEAEFGDELSDRLLCSDFGFSIPGGSTIDGIVVKVSRKATSSSADNNDDEIKIIKGGTLGTTDKAQAGAWGTTEQVITYGSDSDLWDLSWTAADINASTFGVSIAANINHTDLAQINYVTITVYYT